MSGLSDEAVAAGTARSDELIDYWDLTTAGMEVADVEREILAAAYPVIRTDVLAEVAGALRADQGPAWLRPNEKRAIAAWLEEELGVRS